MEQFSRAELKLIAGSIEVSLREEVFNDQGGADLHAIVSKIAFYLRKKLCREHVKMAMTNEHYAWSPEENIYEVVYESQCSECLALAQARAELKQEATEHADKQQ